MNQAGVHTGEKDMVHFLDVVIAFFWKFTSTTQDDIVKRNSKKHDKKWFIYELYLYFSTTFCFAISIYTNNARAHTHTRTHTHTHTHSPSSKSTSSWFCTFASAECKTKINQIERG
jgi:hypothetical protein